MIAISGNIMTPESLMTQYPETSIEAQILDQMTLSSEVYHYTSLEMLKFELSLRKNIVSASIQLNESRLAFKTFRESICNEKYWKRTDEGGFILQDGVKPSEAIRDIYLNSSLYGTECATAIVIVFYKAIAEIFPEDLFDRVFSKIYLMNWQYLDKSLGIVSSLQVKDYFPGDCRYIKNPEVDPLKPEWQGENLIELVDEKYYGHGVGIKTIEKFISILNEYRIDGATQSAYLMDQAIRLDFKYLAILYLSYSPRLLAYHL